MKLKNQLLSGFSAIVGLVVTCAASARGDDSKPSAKPDEPRSTLEAPKEVAKPKESLSDADAELLSAHKLVHQDKIKYTIQEDPVRDAEFPELIVSSLGQLTFPVSRVRQSPLISVQAVGKTTEQVKTELVAGLEADYYHKVTVTIQLTSRSERFGQVVFVGSIIKGLLKLNPGEQKKLSDAIVEKGYTDYAQLRKVKIIRSEPGVKNPKIIVVDVDAILRKGRKDLDKILQDGDTIQVPEKGLVF